ncbi:MAG TPA: sigma-70 family RNA polymerase sigma factor [Tepidisphaeraceae bacterium]|jgi:RNA polymerase sigma factor (sigma-70 family)
MSQQGDESEEAVELGQRLRHGDDSVLQEVLEQYGPATARALSLRYPRLTEQDLEEALSTALFNLWQARARYSPERGSLRSWFFLIARNAASDMAREKDPAPEQVEWEDLAETESGVDEGSAVPADPVMRDRLLALLATLGEDDLRLLLAPTWSSDGRWSETLSQEMNVEPGTLRVRRSRLLKRLRSALKSNQWETGSSE